MRALRVTALAGLFLLAAFLVSQASAVPSSPLLVLSSTETPTGYYFQLRSITPSGADRGALALPSPLAGLVTAVSPEGQRFAYLNGDSLWVMDPQGENQSYVAGGPETPVSRAVWSPDGQHIAFTALVQPGPTPGETNAYALFVVKTDGSGLRRIGFGGGDGFDFSANSSQVVFFNLIAEGDPLGDCPGRRAVKTIVRFDIQTLERTRLDPCPAQADGIIWDLAGSVAVSPDGHLGLTTNEFSVFVDPVTGQMQSRSRFWLVDPDSGGARVVSESTYPTRLQYADESTTLPDFIGASFSPDGAWLAVLRTYPGRSVDRADIILVEVATGEITPVAGTLGLNPVRVTWSPATPPPPPVSASADQTVVAGGTVATNATVSAADPIGTAVTTPEGGQVTISEAATSEPAPVGYDLLGQQVQITAPAATVLSPLSIDFILDASLVPVTGADTVSVFRDGVAAVDCSGAAGVASPDPCVASRVLHADGSLTLRILTSHASTWTLGVHKPFAFSGFFSPVDNLPILNLAKAGSAIPVKFALGADQGLAVLAAGSPKSQAIACSSTAPVDGIEETVSAGQSSLKYDAAGGRYSYVWKTVNSWVGTCRQLIVKLSDGTSHRANFKFK